jgi:hypothetical protein
MATKVAIKKVDHTIPAPEQPQDPLFKAFSELLAQHLSIESEDLETIHQCIQKVYQIPIPAASAAGTTTRRVSAWNVYMKQEMAARKGKGIAGSQLMKEIGASWKTLPEADKVKYQTTETITGKAVVHRRSGYNIYFSEQTPLIKPTVPSAVERMKHIGASWKALTPEQQAVYNARAKG